MNIVDSSCWLEYLMDTEIGANVAQVIENPGELVVPTITLYEVYKKLLTEKSEEYALFTLNGKRGFTPDGTVLHLEDITLTAEVQPVNQHADFFSHGKGIAV